MKRMNLLPPELRPRDGKRHGAAYVVIAVLGVSVAAMLAYGVVLSGVRSSESELASLKEEASRAQERADALAPYGEFADMKDRRERSVLLVSDTRFDYERLTRELARILPDGVSVGHLEVAPAPPEDDVLQAGADSAAAEAAGTPPALTVSGCAPGQDAVADTLDRLRALTGATDVKLGASGDPGAGTGGSSGSRVVGGAGSCGGHVAFDATVTLTAPDAESAARSTPASLETGQ
jgi:hypothetical protein